MRSHKRKLILIGSFLALVSACGGVPVKVYDKEVCADLGSSGAHCAHTLTNKTRDIDKIDWDEKRIGFLCMDSAAYNDTETAIDQFCRAIKCDYVTRQQISAAVARLKSLSAVAMRAREEHRRTLEGYGVFREMHD